MPARSAPAYHANIITYTAARFDQEALEDPKLGHGLFTYAVVEGLQGKGGFAARKQISTKDLAAYVIKRVEELGETTESGAGASILQGAGCRGLRPGALVKRRDLRREAKARASSAHWSH